MVVVSDPPIEVPDALASDALVIQVRVPWSDLDEFGHVNNVRYFGYFEVARIAYFDQVGVMDRPVGPILHSTSCRFRAAVRYPDHLLVSASVSALGADRFTVQHKVWSRAQQKLAATGEVVVVSFDYEQGLKAPLPPAWRDGIVRMQPERAAAP